MMEFSLREWLILVGVIVILGVLFDGYRRVRSGARGKLKMSINKNLKRPSGDRMDYFNGELPNGGAREVTRGEDDHQSGKGDIEQESPIPAFDVAHELRPDPLFANESEPQISDVLTTDNEAIVASITETETTQVQADAVDIKAAPESQSSTIQQQTAEAETQKKSTSYQDVEEVIVMNVFAKDENGFNGSDLMRVILACGMRYGDMNIFHRSEEGDDSVIQFSMANVVKPGTFDLDNMGDFYTPGVSFFLSLPGPKDSLKALDYMHETAQCVVKNLNGELKDEMHSAMTGQTIEHSRQKVRDFERRQLSLLR